MTTFEIILSPTHFQGSTIRKPTIRPALCFHYILCFTNLNIWIYFLHVLDMNLYLAVITVFWTQMITLGVGIRIRLFSYPVRSFWWDRAGCFRRLEEVVKAVEVASLLLQAYVTSRHMWREHSQAAHTHIDPDVRLRAACGRLLAQEQKIAGKELQLWLSCDCRHDDLKEEETA